MHTGTGLAGYQGARLEDGGPRLFALALLCSVLLHALVLSIFLQPEEFKPMNVAPPLTARFVESKRPPQPQKAAPEAAPAPQPSLPAVRPAPVPAPAAAPAPLTLPVAASPAPAPSVALPKPVAPPAVVTQPQAAVAPAEVSAPDPGSIARYRLELMDLARQHKRYPRFARDNNWEGRVDLRVAFAENGAIASLGVKQSSGREVLDEAAREMIRNAQAQAPLPPALRGKAFALDISVDFLLKDETR